MNCFKILVYLNFSKNFGNLNSQTFFISTIFFEILSETLEI